MDDKSAVLGKISHIAGSILANPNLVLTEETTARDVSGWDSLAHVQIILGVERAFGIKLSSMEIAQLENAGSLADIVIARAN